MVNTCPRLGDTGSSTGQQGRSEVRYWEEMIGKGRTCCCRHFPEDLLGQDLPGLENRRKRVPPEVS